MRFPVGFSENPPIQIINRSISQVLPRITITCILVLGLCLHITNTLADETGQQQHSEEHVRQTMLDGVAAATARYGKEGGLYNDPRLRLPMPSSLRKAEKIVRRLGGDGIADQFILTLNRTAEKTLESSAPLLSEHISTMPIENSEQLVDGSNDAIGDYFAASSHHGLIDRIFPVMQTVYEQQGTIHTLRQLLKSARLVRAIHKIKSQMDEYLFKAVIGLVVYSIKADLARQ